MKIINRKAKFDYNILEKFEFGIVLNGCEVKSIRAGKISINNTYINYDNDHVYIHNMHINAWEGERKKTEENKSRIILLKKKEKNKIIAITKEPRKTVVPLELYFNKRGFVKILCAIAEGKTQYDKRAAIKEREWKMQKNETKRC